MSTYIKVKMIFQGKNNKKKNTYFINPNFTESCCILMTYSVSNKKWLRVNRQLTFVKINSRVIMIPYPGGTADVFKLGG